MTPLHVAVDVAPLHGHRTGVGVATAGIVDAIGRRDDVTLAPYLVSFRARPVPPERRLPLPAGLAMRAWARGDVPRVDRWLRDASVVHGTNYVAPPSRLPTVISVYDCWFLAHPDEASNSVRRAARVLRRAVRRGAWIHVSSQATADVAAELLGTDRIRVVHLGPPTVEADPLAPEAPTFLHGHPFLLAIGTTERRKDIPSLVRAFARLDQGSRDLRLVIAGAPGDHHDQVLDAVAGLDHAVRQRVHVTGTVDAATKHALLARAEALVYPSLDEGFGFPVLEAQAAGTAVVACRVGSIPEVAGLGAELVEPASVEALAAGIGRVLDDTSHRHALVTAGRDNLRRFSWQRCADGLVDLYREAIEDQP